MGKLGNLDYDEDKYDRNRAGYAPLPDGAYNVEIVTSEQKKWDDGGVQLGVTYKVIDGDCADKIIFDNLQVKHSDPQVQSIARAALHKICDNLGHDWPLTDDQALLGGVMTIVLKTKKSKTDERTFQNVVSREPYDGAAAKPVSKAAAKPAAAKSVAKPAAKGKVAAKAGGDAWDIDADDETPF